MRPTALAPMPTDTGPPVSQGGARWHRPAVAALRTQAAVHLTGWRTPHHQVVQRQNPVPGVADGWHR